MKNKYGILIIMTIVVSVSIIGNAYLPETIFAQDVVFPSWIKNTALWWGEGKISDNEFLSALQWMVDNRILNIPQPETNENTIIDRKINFDKISLEVTGLEELIQNSNIRQTLVDSNDEFNKIEDVFSVLEQRDKEWTSASLNEITPFMKEIIENPLSEQLREHSNLYQENFGYDVYPEIFVTNAFGVNIAQTGKTTDYIQNDESWWLRAKQDGVYISEAHYDESADVYSADIALRVNDNVGGFLGVIKGVTNVDQIFR